VNVLVVFARWPAPGMVKRRLSPALPPDLATRLHRAMLEDTLAAARRAPADRRVLALADPPTPLPTLPEWEGFEIVAQSGADLGERMALTFERGLEPPDARVVIVGSDAPEITAEGVGQAFDALGTHDLVLGPTPDGGYYLIGLSRLVPGLFRGVEWGSERVLEQTLERAAADAARVARLSPLGDLDTPADLVAMIARQLERRTAPATAAALAEFGLLPAPAGTG
jgi:uncharacterized protein